MREQLNFNEKNDKLKKKMGYSYYLVIVILFFACRPYTFPLDPFFNELALKSPKTTLMQFKIAPLDSVVLNHLEYSEIFDDAAAIVLQDSTQQRLFDDFLEKNNMDSEQDLYTIIAAFHKRLNNEKVCLYKLRTEMIDLANRHNERKYGKPEQK